jgi:hypothetical protein
MLFLFLDTLFYKFLDYRIIAFIVATINIYLT